MLFMRCQNIRVRSGQAVVEALNHGHGQNDLAVFMRFEDAEYGVGYVPDDGGFFLNIGAYLINLIVLHSCVLGFRVGKNQLLR